MRSRLLVCVAAALAFAAVASAGGTPATGGGLLFLRTSPDDGRVQQLELWRDGYAATVGPSADWILTPQWSRGGVLAVLVGGRRIVLFSASGKRLRVITAPFDPEAHMCGIAWSPDGKQLAVRTTHSELGLWALTVAGQKWQQLPVSVDATTVDNCALSWG